MRFTCHQLNILKVLMDDPEGEIHFRDLARRLEREPGVIQKSLNNLEAGGLVQSRRRGNQRLIRFNVDHPLAEDVKNIEIPESRF
jgi:predicted transcriptional regulator